MEVPLISAIVPTIGRPTSLRELLGSLEGPYAGRMEVIVADASEGHEVSDVVAEPAWARIGLRVVHLRVSPPNAVRQRNAAIERARGEYLLLLDDDVVVESRCVANMLGHLESRPDAVAVTAMISNQPWPPPTRLWRLYLRHVLALRSGEWQGRVLGPLLRYGYDPAPPKASPMQWIGTGNSMVRRADFMGCGGFSDFFLHRCTMNEDVDLGLKLANRGTILLAPDCGVVHNHAPSGRVSARIAAEDDAYNRFMILSRTLKYSYWKSARLMLLYLVLESMSDLGAVARGRGVRRAMSRLYGRASGFAASLGSRTP